MPPIGSFRLQIDMQTSGKEARFWFPECSLPYAKAMQTSGKEARFWNANERKGSSLLVSRVQLALCKDNYKYAINQRTKREIVINKQLSSIK